MQGLTLDAPFYVGGLHFLELKSIISPITAYGSNVRVKMSVNTLNCADYYKSFLVNRYTVK
ncbi:hypothetical protein L3i20_v244110 [Paenibacillus sp. L3-i20]|nr:hypothetical protein L3i20_v244110 [Paenibacillus sp. L3-i20]